MLLSRSQAVEDASGGIAWDVSVDSTAVGAHQHAAGARKVSPAAVSQRRAERGTNQVDPVLRNLAAHLEGAVRSVNAWDVPAADSPSVPQSARIRNYWLGGKDNHPVDEAAGDAYSAVLPGIVTIARSSRAFLSRNITHLVTEAGIRQFLDVRTGLPTGDNTHEVAQRLAPETRIVYVDHDPMVLAHARTLLTSTPEGATAYIDAELTDPDRILAVAAETLDLTRPTALILSKRPGSRRGLRPGARHRHPPDGRSAVR